MSEWYLGEIRIFAGNFAPLGWMFCDGRILSIAEYDTLFNLIGTTYGGDGQSTFGLPDLRGRSAVHQGTISGGSGTHYQLAEALGVETVTLTGQQIPAHGHAAMAAADPTTSSPAGAIWSSQAPLAFSGAAPSTQLAPQSVQPAGGSQPHDNMPPFVATSYIIAVTGIYPQQN